MKKALKLAAGLLAVTFGVQTAQAGQRLDAIQARGSVNCGIHPVVAGFASVDVKRGAQGMDVDICRAVAAAIFGNPNKVVYIEARNVNQLHRGDNTDIDIIARRITWSLTRATSNGLMFGPITFYDGQGFLVPKKSGITKPSQLNGKSVCVQAIEAHATSVKTYFQESGLKVTAVAVDTDAQAERAMSSGTCAAFSADISWLGAARAAMAGGVEAFDILPDLISKEPLAPLIRQGDDQFFEIVRWSIFAMIAAEEYGITSQNIDTIATGPGTDGDLEIRQFLGRVPGNGAALGLREDWAYDVVKHVGNYGEVFERNVGDKSPIKLTRGLNKLWRDGGLMYAPRLR